MKNSPVCDDIHPVFVALGITRDILDQVCDIMDQLTRVLEDGKRRLKPYQADKASDLESLDLLIGRLPPKNALALAVARMRIA